MGIGLTLTASQLSSGDGDVTLKVHEYRNLVAKSIVNLHLNSAIIKCLKSIHHFI